MSVCAQKVRLVLAAKGLEHTHHTLDLRAGDQFKPDYLKLNPKAVVPTIVDNGVPIIESTAIISYLDDAYPEPPLGPDDPLQRAIMLRWMILPDASLHDACGLTSFALAFRHQLAALPPQALEAIYAKNPDEKRRQHMQSAVELGLEAPGVDAALRTYHESIQSMAKALSESPWLAGDNWSLADITMLPYVLRLEHLGLEWFWSEAPLVADWLVHCKDRSEYSVIEDNLDPKYLELMKSIPTEEYEKVRIAVYQ
jgi:glutathione S-transferase